MTIPWSVEIPASSRQALGCNFASTNESFFMKKSIALRLAVINAAVFGAVSSAHAALPAEATTAIADMKSDGALLAGAFLVVCIAIAAVKILRKGT